MTNAELEYGVEIQITIGDHSKSISLIIIRLFIIILSYVMNGYGIYFGLNNL